MLKVRYFIISLFFLIVCSCVKDASGVKNISIEELKTVIEKDKNIQLLDVRLASEAKKGMILNAVQVNLISNKFESNAVNVLDIEKPVYVYCRSGARSKIAAKILVDRGYDVFNVKGGYRGWLEKNKKGDK